MKPVASPFTIDYIETTFGKFILRPKTLDLLSASPAYERRDVTALLRLIRYHLHHKQRVAFLDIGADFGYYSILIGNKFRHEENVSVYAFEPYPTNYTLLKKNRTINNLQKKITLYHTALTNIDNAHLNFHFNPLWPGSSAITTGQPIELDVVQGHRLDTLLLKELQTYDVVVMKIDVEGHETEVLQGATKILTTQSCVLLVEDFVKPMIVEYLNNTDMIFLYKLTPYNSWWSTKASNTPPHQPRPFS